MRQYRAKRNIGESVQAGLQGRTRTIPIARLAAKVRFAAIALVALNVAACSVTLPLAGWSSLDEEPQAARTTGSLRPLPLQGAVQTKPVAIATRPGAMPATGGPVGFSRDLGPEDLRRANGALGLALDPQGNGANVAWDNPQSGMKGVVMPVGGPFLKSDEICRNFTAVTALQSGPLRQKGVACRPSGGEWVIKDMQRLAGA